MKQELSVVDAINDPERPLTTSPEEWLNELKKKDGEMKISEPNKVDDSDEEFVYLNKLKNADEAIVRIEESIDSFAKGLRLFETSHEFLSNEKLADDEITVLNDVDKLIKETLKPCIYDIINEFGKLNQEIDYSTLPIKDALVEAIGRSDPVLITYKKESTGEIKQYKLIPVEIKIKKENNKVKELVFSEDVNANNQIKSFIVSNIKDVKNA